MGRETTRECISAPLCGTSVLLGLNFRVAMKEWLAAESLTPQPNSPGVEDSSLAQILESVPEVTVALLGGRRSDAVRRKNALLRCPASSATRRPWTLSDRLLALSYKALLPTPAN